MIIAVNTRFLLKDKLEGIGWFTFEALRRMVKQHPEHRFHFLFDRPFDPAFVFADNVTAHVLAPPARHPVLWYLWFEYSVPRVLRRIKPDVFLSTDGYLSLKADCPQVLVVHDLAFEHFPNHVNRLTLRYYKHFTPRYARKATRIATVSAYSKNDLVERYGTSPDKIDVVYNGANEAFKPLTADEAQNIRNRYSSGQPYFVFAGAVQPRKNVDRLMLAFDRFKTAYGLPHKLVIAGRFAWKTESVKRAYDNMLHKQDVVLTGHLGRADLAALTGAAEALVYVSLFEGFGIPIVEAFQCRVPVITSNTSSMPEVAGGGALVVDPLYVEAIAKAMHDIASSPALRNALVEAGGVQLKKFSWDLTADRLWQTILKTQTPLR